MSIDNFQRSEELIRQAKDIFDEMEQALERGNWNLAIRRAQEASEISLKALVKAIGIEFPKEHDIGYFLVEALKRRKIPVEKGDEQNVILFSRELVEDRLPSFYFEKAYTEEEAQAAMKRASWITNFISVLYKKLRGGENDSPAT